jgi:hypothetical protein
MFGGKKEFAFYVNPIDRLTYEIGSLVSNANHAPRAFDTLEDVEEWIND